MYYAFKFRVLRPQLTVPPSTQPGQVRGLDLQSLGLAPPPPGEIMLEEGPMSDTTASAPGSDDEVGSNAATDGSTLRTSPAEHAGSAGSESGGSAADSMSGKREMICHMLSKIEIILIKTWTPKKCITGDPDFD